MAVTVLFVVNPASGGGGAEARLPAIAAYCRDRGIEAIIRRTSPEVAIGRLVPRILTTISRPDRVVVVGGDGTVTETAAALAAAGLPLAVIPLGTGNDFARGIGMPVGRDLHSLLEFAVSGRYRTIDMARYRTGAGSGIFLNVAGTGFDAAVVEASMRLKRRIRHPLVYLLAILSALPRLGFSDVRIEADGIRRRRRTLLVAVANGRRYGGGIRINPEGTMDDGVLELVIYRAVSPVRMAATLPRFLLGRHRGLGYLETLACRSVRIDADPPLPVHVDGDIRGKTPLRAEILPGGLAVVMPPW